MDENLKELSKTIKRNILNSKGEKTKMIYFSSGCLLLDLVLGGKKGVFGVPAGRFINFVGDKSAGKTFLSNEFLANAYHKNPKKFHWMYDDCESGYSFDTNELYGVNLTDEKHLIHSKTVEDAFCNITEFAEKLKKEEYGIYVLDSLDGLTSAEQEERAKERIKAHKENKKFDKGTYGMGKQKYLSQEFFPQLSDLCEDKNVLVIIVSQIREKIDVFSFDKYNRSGGKAMDFYAHSVLWLAGGKKIKKKDRAIGTSVKAKTTKSKTSRPYRDCWFTLIYDYGLDDIGSCIDFLFDLRTDSGELAKTAKMILWKEGKEKLTLKSAKAFLQENELTDEYEDSKYFDGKADLNSIGEFIASKKDYINLFSDKFGEVMNRDDLISYIEENDLVDELHERTIEKWEAIEEEIRSKRKKKYATIPQVKEAD